jgi:hypothetical protein
MHIPSTRQCSTYGKANRASKHSVRIFALAVFPAALQFLSFAANMRNPIIRNSPHDQSSIWRSRSDGEFTRVVHCLSFQSTSGAPMQRKISLTVRQRSYVCCEYGITLGMINAYRFRPSTRSDFGKTVKNFYFFFTEIHRP